MKRFGSLDEGEEEGEDALDTPAPNRVKRTKAGAGKGGVNLTLRDQEKVRRTAPWQLYEHGSTSIYSFVSNG